MAGSNPVCLMGWSCEDVRNCLIKEGFCDNTIKVLCDENELDGKCLLVLNESDFSIEPLSKLTLKDRKTLYLLTKTLQRENQNTLLGLGILENQNTSIYSPQPHYSKLESEYSESERISPPISEDGRPRYPPEKTKTLLAFLYVVFVTWITAFVMVIVHDRVPDMKKYPPLPDIFLDNVPHIPWAFDMCEVTGTILFTMWLIVHSHETVFRTFRNSFPSTMRDHAHNIAKCSGAHLQCQPRNFPGQGSSVFADLAKKLSQAYVIWRGADYKTVFSNFSSDLCHLGVIFHYKNTFLDTPRYIYYLHTLSWMMNLFGIFFILAAHEHYSIDVFVAFYITSRLFLYYHTLSNNQALMQRDSTRTKVWFPLFSYFESGVDGIVPNEYETPKEIAENLCGFIKGFYNDVKAHILVTAKSNTSTHQVIETVSKTIIENSKTK
ncbi:hypothetical protein NQ317_012362 [Molorchus minor]|uniref:Sphingomyelin synthase-like domain-containing protein n=1 Tax=Molorchus minor TaxID=1323400 RepID=A0ABQ9J1W9_9CUCU|nr:hypothetical protein NQ317_012362 [Molorchus minor]